MMKTKAEIEDKRADAEEWTAKGTSDARSMSYEEGVAAALAWVTGDGDDPIENRFES